MLIHYKLIENCKVKKKKCFTIKQLYTQYKKNLLVSNIGKCCSTRARIIIYIQNKL